MIDPKNRKFRICNLRKDTEDLRDFQFKTLIKDKITTKKFLESLPSQIDHSGFMSSVKDQKNLGSCAGFSAAAMKEGQENKEHRLEVEAGKKDHRDNKYYDLSESWIYWMAKRVDAWPNEEGTSIRAVMQVLHKIGVPCEKAWPYDDVVYGEPKKWAKLVARWSLIDSYYRLNNLNEIKGALVNGPVLIGVGVFEEMLSVGADGVVPYPSDPWYSYGGHALCCVGYSDKTKRIKIKNSWGKNWGVNGYGFLSYDYVESYLWDSWACKDLTVTKEMLKGARELIE